MEDPITTQRLRDAAKAKRGTWVAAGVLTVLTTGLLASVVNWWEQDTIEADLISRTQLALRDNGMAPEGVSFDGREATLYGSLASDQDAIAAVRGVPGVRSVNADGEQSEYHSSAVDTDEPKVSTALGGRVMDVSVLRGRVSQLQAEQPILFSPDSTDVSAEGLRTIDGVAALLKENPQAKAEVAGHSANESGASESNVALAADNRASVVFDLLVERGVPVDQLTAEGYADTQPMETPETSRRVEIIVR
ncbi:OmpA family protein [Tamaricihabitans halophyticus]|uniref:OmpA family protein n=1 Tax=Tamaricihabitans halophyticus TaxID=1262583 RepID=A0A4R2R277_9PSEU|nr:OmpA family protein [Tamaricihabitans halophyticus]TCP56623.1 OmpA family protein [Tamaricihabitans halophyticus]